VGRADPVRYTQARFGFCVGFCFRLGRHTPCLPLQDRSCRPCSTTPGSRDLRPFTPLRPDYVGLYCCGPTVYEHAHIGNLRTYVFEDVLGRALALNGRDVRHVVNITDVGHLVSDADEGEDKMEKVAAAPANPRGRSRSATPLRSRRIGAR
jgi:hypothetical protein